MSNKLNNIQVAKSKKTRITKSKSNKIDQTIINDFIDDPTLFILNNNAQTLINLIKYTTDKYYNDQPVISDELFDFVIDTLRDIDPEHLILKQVGSKVLTKSKTKLKYWMGSMDKIKPSDPAFLNKWLTKYKGPYIYSDKLDGVSALFVCANSKMNLYTRGDGMEGTDISNLIKYISGLDKLELDKLKFDKISKLDKNSQSFAVRGELIMSKTNFTKYANTMSNARNMVSGVVNSKSFDPKIVSDIDFVSYEIIDPWLPTQSKQFEKLNKMGFKVVPNSFIDIESNTESNTQLDFMTLSQILTQRLANTKYEIDGLIISNNILPPQRTQNTNPEYAFAFKDPSLSQIADVKVLGINWSISKDGYIKPVLKLVPTSLGGVVISNVTAINAKYVQNNILGPGAIIQLIRSGDVIPKIIGILKPASSGIAQFPDIDYEWNETGVDIIAIDQTLDQQIKELVFFFKKLDISNIDESTVRKMINANIDSIGKILTIKINDLVKVEGFKEKMVEKIYNNICDRIKNLTMLDLMIASNVFGHGMGSKKLKKIISSYPDIIGLYTNYSQEEIIQMIKQLDGFDTKTAEYFNDGLERFIDLFNSLEPNMRKQLRISTRILAEEIELANESLLNKTNIPNRPNKFMSKIFVFSGFRNKAWESIIESNGGKVGSAISSKTNVLITTKADIKDGSNAKISKARKLNIQILDQEQFEQEFDM
jgi:DNA ligase (NAD+)